MTEKKAPELAEASPFSELMGIAPKDWPKNTALVVRNDYEMARQKVAALEASQAQTKAKVEAIAERIEEARAHVSGHPDELLTDALNLIASLPPASEGKNLAEASDTPKEETAK